MSEFSDLLLSEASPIVALCLVVLGVADTLLVGYVRRRFNRMEERLDGRLARLEDALIATDGGIERGDIEDE